MIILNTELEQMVYFHAKRMLFLRLCLKKALKSTEGSIIHYRSSGLKVTILESLFAECFFKQFIITTLLIYSGGGNGVIESEWFIIPSFSFQVIHYWNLVRYSFFYIDCS